MTLLAAKGRRDDVRGSFLAVAEGLPAVDRVPAVAGIAPAERVAVGLSDLEAGAVLRAEPFGDAVQLHEGTVHDAGDAKSEGKDA